MSVRTSTSSRPKIGPSMKPADGGSVDKVIDFVNMNRDKYLEELKAFLAIPSISALPEHAGDVKRCAEWCADEMRRIGMQNVKLIRSEERRVGKGVDLGGRRMMKKKKRRTKEEEANRAE